MVVVRVGLLALYLGGMTFLNRYLRERFPTSDIDLVPGGAGAGRALLWIWGPTLWMVPGMLWIGILNLPLVIIALLSFLLPLTCLLLFLWRYKIVSVVPVVSALLVALLVVLAALRTPDLSHAKFGLFSVSSIIPPLFSIWLLVTWAPEVVPLARDLERRTRQALSLVLGFFTGQPKSTWVVEDGRIRTRIQGTPWFGSGPGLLITEPENVVVLKCGSEIGRVAGPGVVLTRQAESPFRVVDLRNQVRGARINAITRDGIEVQAAVSSMFGISRGHSDVRLGKPWPYRNQRDVLQALFAEEVDPTGRSPLDAHLAHPWEDLPTSIAAHKLEQAASFYSLDQLYGGITDDELAETEGDPQAELMKTHRKLETALGLPPAPNLGDSLTRSTISQLVLRTVRQALESRGFEVQDGGVSGAILPLSRGVTEQRVEAWKSRFIAKVMDWEAAVERKRFAALGKIRQDAGEKLLTQMIEEVSQRLQATDDDTQRDVVAYYMLSSLMEIAGNPEVRRMLPESALPVLEDLYQQVSERAGLEGDS